MALGWALWTLSVHGQPSSASFSCPQNAREDTERPRVLSNCQSYCGYVGFCVYYPYKYQDQCVELYDGECRRGPECTVECFRQESTNLNLYSGQEELDRWAMHGVVTSLPQVLVNTSLVTRWDADEINTTELFVYGSSDYYIAGDTSRLSPVEPMAFDLPRNTLDASWNLSTLLLSRVPCPPFPEYDQKYASLKNLQLMSCKMTEFPWRNSSAPELEVLVLADNQIKELPSLPLSVMTLDLTTNAITKIPPSVAKMKNLLSLYLSNNPIKTIPAKTLPTALTNIALSNCSLTKMPEDLGSMTNLISIDLSYNPLGDAFDESKLSALILTDLNVAWCGLTRMPSKFKESEELAKIDVSGNPIPVEDLKNIPPTVTTFVMRSANLTRIPPFLASYNRSLDLDLTDNPIETIKSGDLGSLTSLQLSNTPLKVIEEDVFGDNLIILSIRHSQLTEIPERLTKGPKVGKLNLEHNRITHMKAIEAAEAYMAYNAIETYDKNIHKVEKLDLSYNALSSFSERDDTSLSILKLRGNKLTTVPEVIFQARLLRVLDLRDNPIQDYQPSQKEWAFFQGVPSVLMDQEQLRTTKCSKLIRFRANVVCDPNGAFGDDLSPDDGGSLSSGSTFDPSANAQATSSSSSSKMTIVVVVVVVAVVLLILGAVWQYQKRKRSDQAMGKSYDSTGDNASHGSEDRALWQDEELMMHRIDPSLVQVERLLATGAYGEVFLATYHQQRVVVKRLKAPNNTSRKDIQQFIKEIKLMANFRFPKIVRFIGVVWTKESDVAVLTEYMENGDLRSYLAKTKRYAKDGWTLGKLRIALDIAEALVYLHSLDPPMIHRDLKSRNVLLDQEMRACLSDFGTTRPVAENETMTGGVGTARWMAPEVLTGRRYDQSADIYSLGVILNELDTHELPYHEELHSDDGTQSNQTSGSFQFVQMLSDTSIQLQFLPTCPSELVQLSLRCSAYEPADRVSTLEAAYEIRRLLRHTEAQLSAERSSKGSKPHRSNAGLRASLGL
ncbi:hypothetical protein Poli38472_010861 [Pythium oligandrum]|uniref:Protein kinase domain-containing protein n=1 Tax=Pythium oligandrum TaxID=41045 RepID=A0A8K1FKJ8_PYTOL|nr:hypothetical protein Poli38472_010861 [Pythium oligandrum]|eukprot:TMW61798.1 hypothetical protein Poli38472_010861 [Pythium oligandrum]